MNEEWDERDFEFFDEYRSQFNRNERRQLEKKRWKTLNPRMVRRMQNLIERYPDVRKRWEHT